MATKLLHEVIFHEDITQPDLKSLHNTEFQQWWCITFKDKNICLGAIFIFPGLILFFVATQIHFCQYLRTRWIYLKTDFALKHWVQGGRFEHHEPYNWNNYHYYKVSVLLRGFCHKQQNQTIKNENGTQKKVHFFKSNAPTLLKLSLGFYHM